MHEAWQKRESFTRTDLTSLVATDGSQAMSGSGSDDSDADLTGGDQGWSQQEVATLEQDDVIPMRIVRSDKNEATRGDRSLEEHPIKAKSRMPELERRGLRHGRT